MLTDCCRASVSHTFSTLVAPCTHHGVRLSKSGQTLLIIDYLVRLRLFLVQFSLLNGSIHDSWLQQGHEGMSMDEEMWAKCEVLACIHKPHNTDPSRKKSDKVAEVCCSLMLENELLTAYHSRAIATFCVHATSCRCVQAVPWGLKYRCDML